jgi:hypothetical protein
MNIIEYCQALDLEIEIYHSPTAVNQWIAKLRKPFYDVAFKDTENSGLLCYPSGQAQHPVMAIKMLCATLRWTQYMVLDPREGAGNKERMKHKIPSLTYDD